MNELKYNEIPISDNIEIIDSDPNSKNKLKNNVYSNINYIIYNKDSCYNILKYYLKRHLNIISIIIFALSIYYYLQALQACPKDILMMQCLAKFGLKEVNILLNYIKYSTLLSSLLIVLYTYKILKSKSLLSVFLIIYLVIFLSNTGTDIYDHGFYNTIIFMILNFFYISLLYLIIFTYRNIINNTKITLMIIIIILVLIYNLYINITSNTCDYWDKGFKDTKINNNSETKCIVPIPKICYFKILDNIFDFPRYINQKCDQKSTYYSLSNSISHTNIPNAKYFAYPITTQFDTVKDTNVRDLQKNVLKNMIDMEDKTSNNTLKLENTEFIVDYRNDSEFNVILNLKKNNTLEQERIDLSNKTQINDGRFKFKNNLIIFIDSLSRTHFIRKLPKLFTYLESHYNNKQSKYSSYQFFKYNSLYPGTVATMSAALYGAFPGNKKGYSVMKKFQDSGYIIGTAMNYCGREAFDIEKDVKFTFHKSDHELVAPFCDNSFFDLTGPYKIFNGPFCMARKCLWGKDTVSYVTDYVKQMFDKYPNNNKFFLASLVDSHEGSGETVKYIEDDLLDLLNYLDKNNHLEDTFVTIMGDHGFFMPGTLYQYMYFKDFQIEMTTPSLFMLLPKKANNYFDIDKYLKSNEQSMITTFDLYETWSSIVHKENNNRKGSDLFSNIKDIEVTNCDSLKIKPENCRCFKTQKEADKFINSN